jgi:hypothetical protein
VRPLTQGLGRYHTYPGFLLSLLAVDPSALCKHCVNTGFGHSVLASTQLTVPYKQHTSTMHSCRCRWLGLRLQGWGRGDDGRMLHGVLSSSTVATQQRHSSSSRADGFKLMDCPVDCLMHVYCHVCVCTAFAHVYCCVLQGPVPQQPYLGAPP